MKDLVVKQAIVKPGVLIDSNKVAENIELFDEAGSPISLADLDLIPQIPAEGTHVLKAVDGELTWVSE